MFEIRFDRDFITANLWFDLSTSLCIFHAAFGYDIKIARAKNNIRPANICNDNSRDCNLHSAVNRTLLPLSLDGSVKLKLGLPLNSRGLVLVYNPSVNLDLDFQPLISPRGNIVFLRLREAKLFQGYSTATFRYLSKPSPER